MFASWRITERDFISGEFSNWYAWHCLLLSRELNVLIWTSRRWADKTVEIQLGAFGMFKLKRWFSSWVVRHETSGSTAGLVWIMSLPPMALEMLPSILDHGICFFWIIGQVPRV